MWHYFQIDKLSKFEMNNKNETSNWIAERMEEKKTLTEEVFCSEFFAASSSELPSGEEGVIYATLSFKSSIELPLSLLNCKPKSSIHDQLFLFSWYKWYSVKDSVESLTVFAGSSSTSVFGPTIVLCKRNLSLHCISGGYSRWAWRVTVEIQKLDN